VSEAQQLWVGRSLADLPWVRVCNEGAGQMAKMKFVGLTVACLFLIACAGSGTKTAANSAGSSGSEQTVAQNTGSVTMTAGEQAELEEPDYEDSFADAE
jgi:hypothetical protein